MEDAFCGTCIITNPFARVLEYTDQVFVSFTPIAWWLFVIGFVLTCIMYGLRMLRFSVTDNPHDDPAALAVEIFGAVMWGVFGFTLLVASSDQVFSVQGFWKVILEVTTGAGIDLVKDLNPDLEAPAMASNGLSRLIGMFENVLFYFIEAGFNSAEGVEDDSWIPSFHQMSSGLVTFAYGLIIALLALFLIIYFMYVVISQACLGALTTAFGSLLSVAACFKQTRSMFFAGMRVMANAGLIIMAASVSVGFMVQIMTAFVEAARCIRTAGEGQVESCEVQLGLMQQVLGGVGDTSMLLRYFGAVEFFAVSVMLIVLSALLLYLSQAFVSMITGMRGVEGAVAAFSAAATGVIAGGVGMALKPSKPGADGPGNNSGGDGDASDDGVDQDGDIADEDGSDLSGGNSSGSGESSPSSNTTDSR